MQTNVPKNDWEALLEEAVAYGRLAPWTWIYDSQLFGVEDPESGERLYCSIMGSLGDFLALGVYPGASGYQSFRKLYDVDPDTQAVDALYLQDCLIVSFDDDDILDPEDRTFLESMGGDYRVGNAYPCFRSYKPGYFPWVLDEAEVRMLRLALEQARIFAEEIRDSGAVVPMQSDGHVPEIPFRRFVDGEWRTEKMKTDSPIQLSPPQLSFDPQTLKEAVAGYSLAEKYWLVEMFYMQQPVMEEGDERPYFPKAIVLLDLQSQQIVGMDAVKPHEVEEATVGSLLECFGHHGFLPNQMVVSNRENYILLKEFCKSLGIALEKDEQMNIVEELKSELFANMAAAEDLE